jgi:hypothetical protein
MIKELSEFGKPVCQRKYGEWNHIALKEEPITIELIIDKNGNFKRFISFEKKPTIAEALSSKKGKARLLLDKAEEVLCYGGKASVKKHTLFLNKLLEYQDVPDLQPVIAFYNNNKSNGVDKALLAFENNIQEKARKGNIGFRVEPEETRLHENPRVRNRIQTKYEAKKREIQKKDCSICGGNRHPVEDTPHGMIKEVPSGKTSGCALVSYNEPAFESYRLVGNNNSSYVLSAQGHMLKDLVRSCRMEPEFQGRKIKMICSIPTAGLGNDHRISVLILP